MTNSFKKGIDYIGVTIMAFCHDGKGKFVMHKRSNNARDEHGRWDIAAGALEFGETFEESIKREIKEEYCCDVLELKRINVYNALREHNGQKTHWVGIAFLAKIDPKQVRIGEPEKMDDIGWFTPDSLPSPLHSQFFQNWEIVKKTLYTKKR